MEWILLKVNRLISIFKEEDDLLKHYWLNESNGDGWSAELEMLQERISTQ